MHGYRIVRGESSSEFLQAEEYQVGDDGALTLFGGGESLQRWRAGEWLLVDEIGVRRADRWPPIGLDQLVDRVAIDLALRFGHYVHELRHPTVLQDWRCNDLDSMVLALLDAIGLGTWRCTVPRRALSVHWWPPTSGSWSDLNAAGD